MSCTHTSPCLLESTRCTTTTLLNVTALPIPGGVIRTDAIVVPIPPPEPPVPAEPPAPPAPAEPPAPPVPLSERPHAARAIPVTQIKANECIFFMSNPPTSGDSYHVSLLERNLRSQHAVE